MHARRYQSGFSLVEMMVALAISLVLILGAGQLFLASFGSFDKASNLGDRQAALTFAADVLIRDIRRAEQDSIEIDTSGTPLALSLDVESVSRTYELRENAGLWSLYLVEGSHADPVVVGFQDASAFDIERVAPGFYRVTFALEGEETDIIFHAVNRAEALNP